MLANGNLLYRLGSDAFETNLLGLVQKRITLQDPGLRLHHDLQLTPHGTYLSLTRRSVEVVDFPTSETDPFALPATQIVVDEPAMYRLHEIEFGGRTIVHGPYEFSPASKSAHRSPATLHATLRKTGQN